MAHRLALVGCGAVSRSYYVPACRELTDCEIAWFVDTRIENAQQLAETYGRGKVAKDYREVSDDIDAAIIALPNSLHAEASIFFLEHGRSVLCEKPIATKSSDALGMIEASRNSGARLSVGLIRRQLNSSRLAKSLLDRGYSNGIKQVTCEEGRVFDWPASLAFSDRGMMGGGALLDWGTHIIDLLQWLFQADLELISYADDSAGGVEANVDLQLKIKRANKTDLPCRVLLSRSRKLKNNIVIRGERSSLEIRQSEPDGLSLTIDGQDTRMRAEKEKSEIECFATQIQNFLDKSRDDSENATDACRNLQFIEHCYENRTELSFPWETKPKTKLQLTFPARYGKILLVGASGFVGTRLAEILYLGYGLQLRATIHRAHTAARLARLPIELVSCDILDPEQVMKAMKGCEVVLNCSRGTASPGRGVDFFEEGTSNLLKAAVEHKVKKFIHVSTAAVHRFGVKEQVINENSALDRSHDPYVKGKINAEEIVMKYSSLLPVVILRPMLIYGPYSRDWVVQIVRRLENQQTTIVGDNGLANLVYIDDFVDAILLAIEREEARGEAFIINNDQEKILWKDYVGKISETLGIPPRISPESNLMIRRLSNNISMMRDSFTITRELVKSREALALVAQIPLVLKLGEMLVKGRRREQIQSKLTAAAIISKPDPKILFKYENISSGLNRVFTSRATFSSAKAKAELGFEPHIYFQEGIGATLEWVRWVQGSAQAKSLH